MRALRIPPWLVGPTLAVLIAAAIRVAQFEGTAGVAEFLAKWILPIALFWYGLGVAERYEAQSGGQSIGLGPKFRQRLFLGAVVALDCLCLLILVTGRRF